MDNKTKIDVTCAIIKKGETILVAQRSETMSLPLKWEFPGGKIEEMESAENCIQRELKEELNISVRIVERLKDYPYDYGKVIINLIPFVVDYIDGELVLAEHKKTVWAYKKDLIALDWAAADISILNDYIKNIDA